MAPFVIQIMLKPSHKVTISKVQYNTAFAFIPVIVGGDFI